ncbi:tRNA(Ile)-lysidine synthetase [Candidatus Ruthia magnifica str. Cm (Calyptogena magnifica)]|uniref:tRNA(Ile)-lysidine synthase n=1 Tax=Ruthia magnifica subsp. Calyptogena magnifica TaxID=413404 RepID=A1AVG0_RUTMC|nr:tRNA lysidine(34) synthetase TilS [Candidatus Ruthturnera calyptogenae]ABL01917.1 tRNA(Ile)-lysidine synthetase [Candidatus Ruthia magnifica str. Cm (Calyptogena magnifica)]
MENLKTKDLFLKDKQIVLGLSGGIDSVVLLYYLNTHYPNKTRVIHYNHHLSQYCNEWNKFCEKLCLSLNITYLSIDLYFNNTSNIEENTRKKRYHSLSNSLKKNEVLCTAHHQNDQAETLLLQLFRGSGIKGLAAMPKEKPLGMGIHYRPFLTISKFQIIDYAKNNKLNWIEDDSNKNTNFMRNFLRLEILPKLSGAYKNLTRTLARSAKHQSEALKLIRELADIDMNTYHIINNANRIDTNRLIKLETHRIKNVLRHHLNLLNFLTPSDKIMHQIIELLYTKENTNPLVCWDKYEIRRYQNELYFINKTLPRKNAFCPFYKELKNFKNFSIRYRQEGQRIKLLGKTHTQSLKKVLQEANIPPWERNRLKMYYIDNKLCAIERIGKISNI